MGLVDVYLKLQRPEVYEVEPYVDEHYQPDGYTRVAGVPVVIELQRSLITKAKMQQKIDEFVRTFKEGKHDAKTLLIVSRNIYDFTNPPGFRIEQRPMEAI